MTNTPMQPVADFLFEVGLLAHTPRSGFHFLGSGRQSVAEHTCRTAYIGYALAQLDGAADPQRTLTLCLFHDLTEARTSDLNYVHQKYVDADERQAMSALACDLPFAVPLTAALEEYAARETREAVLAKDADNLEWLLSLKEQADIGNPRATAWMGQVVKRLKTEVAQRLAEQILQTASDHWYAEPDSGWWVERTKNQANRL